MPQEPPLLHLQNVRYAWPGRSGFTLSIPEFALETGSTTLLLGASGSGKSTLLSLICGTVVADQGSVSLAGNDLSTLTAAARDRLRAEQIGLIFQQFNLLPYASVLDNILLPLRFAPSRGKRVSNPKSTAANLCRALDLPPDTLSQRAGTLSVGQQQRVAAARALIGAPPLVIADEPTSSLDAATQGRFLELLFAQTQASNGTLLMVSHDARLASHFDHVVHMEDIVTAEAQAA